MLRPEPYPGLRPYTESEQANFFGRKADQAILVDKILTNRLTLLFAASGVGKSSLLQAAVIPYLKSETGENLSVVYFMDWVLEPLQGLRTAIWQSLQQAGYIAPDAEMEGITLLEQLEYCCLFVRPPLVVMLDQFEEFFRYQTEDARKTFITELTQVITQEDLPLSLVISMREDFALELNAFKPRLPTILFENFYRLEKLGRDSAEQAIVKPVAAVDFAYETELLKALLKDLLRREWERNLYRPVDEIRMVVEPPSLQIVCQYLWQVNQHDSDKLLRLTTYEQAGRADGIIKNFVRDILNVFSKSEKALISKVFDRLVGDKGVKQARTDIKLAENIGVSLKALTPILDSLEQARILKKQRRHEENWYELYHDLFSKSLDEWNLEWKRKNRLRWGMWSGFGVVVLASSLVLSWDAYQNVSSHHLRLSPKQGISDRVEFWQGKPGTWDLFGLQRYVAETDLEREQIEPDKLFTQRLLADVGNLQDELIGLQPLDQRIQNYAVMGDYKTALDSVEETLLRPNADSAFGVSYPLFAIRTVGAVDVLIRVLENPKSYKIREAASNDYNIVSSFSKFAFFNRFDSNDNYQNKIIRRSFFSRQLTIRKTEHKMLELLQDQEDAHVRISAAKVLGGVNAQRATPDLLKLLQDEDISTRKYAIDVLGRLNAQVAIPDLIRLLQDQDPNIYIKAAEVLIRLDAQASIPELMSLLKDQSANVRSSAAKVLWGLNAQVAIPDLIRLLPDQESYVRGSVAEALGRLNAQVAIPDLIRLLSDQESYVRSSAAAALGRLNAQVAIPDLMLLLQDQNADVRKNVAEALGIMNTRRAIPDLLKLLRDSDYYVRLFTAVALVRMHAEVVIPDLIRLLRDQNPYLLGSAQNLVSWNAQLAITDFVPLLQDQEAHVRSMAANILGQVNAQVAIPELVRLLQDQNANVRGMAANALGHLNAQVAIPALVPLLQDQNADVRMLTASALGQLNAQVATPALVPLLQDPSAQVRGMAASVLGRLNVKVAIPDLISLLKDQEANVRDDVAEALIYLRDLGEVVGIHEVLKDNYLNYLSILPHFNQPHLKIDFYSHLEKYLDQIAEISGGELLDLTLRRIRLNDDELQHQAAIAALYLKTNGYLKPLELNVLNKALAEVDPKVLEKAQETIDERNKERAERKANRRPINQPFLEDKPLSNAQLEARFSEIEGEYQQWRKQRNTESVGNDYIENSEALPELTPEQKIYEYAFALAYLDQERGIELLKHNLFKVRQAAASGLVNSEQFTPDLLKHLEKEWHNTQDPIQRQGVYHAIDKSLLVLEGLGGPDEYAFIKDYEAQLKDQNNKPSMTSIFPRVEWTRYQLQWRVEMNQDFEQHAVKQLPDLLKRYCISEDGTDIPADQCTPTF